eukprot:603083-Ditylum_brightwellii.AAC.1
MEDVMTDLPHLESRWIKSLQAYLKKINASVEIHSNIMYPLQWHGSVHLVPQIIKSQQFNEKEIQQINYCCLYLNVMTLADITDARGKKFGSTY